MAAGVADGLLAFGVGPAGAVGDQLAVLADEESADDLGECAELGVGGVDQTGADVVPEPEIAAGRLGVPSASLRPALLVLGRRVAEFVVVDAAPAKYASSRAGAVSLSRSCSCTRSSRYEHGSRPSKCAIARICISVGTCASRRHDRTT